VQNWIPTTNPFGLAQPPAWFLTALAAYDPLLVIFASTSAPLYRLARRTQTGRAQLNKIIRGIPDSAVYLAHTLWAWKSVEPQVTALNNSWQKLLLEIPEYDTQRVGATAAADRLDHFDALEEARINRDIQTELDARNHDAYVLASSRVGSRIGLSTKKPEGARGSRVSRRRAYRPLNFGGGSAIFIGR
jgi:hypothetical protein